MVMLTIGSLFTGYRGLDMAVEQVVGARTVWHCENNPAASRLLAYRFPDVPNLGDITTVDWSTVETVDVLTAGWPCQPFSLAGRRKGTADERALWPYVATAVRMVRPRWVVLENVPAIVTAGELARAVASLAALGYVGSWTCLRAADVGAPHRRERCFLVAEDGNELARQRNERPRRAVAARRSEIDWGAYEPAIRRWEHVLGRVAPSPTEMSNAYLAMLRRRLSRRDRRPVGMRGSLAPVHRLSPRFVEWMMGLPAGWVTGVPGISRNDQLKMLGNGVVPPQAAAALDILLGTEAVAA